MHASTISPNRTAYSTAVAASDEHKNWRICDIDFLPERTQKRAFLYVLIGYVKHRNRQVAKYDPDFAYFASNLA